MHIEAYFDHARVADQKEIFDLLIETLHITVTGGFFGSKNRTASAEKADDIRKKCDELMRMFTDLRLEPKK